MKCFRYFHARSEYAKYKGNKFKRDEDSQRRSEMMGAGKVVMRDSSVTKTKLKESMSQKKVEADIMCIMSRND